MSAENLASIRQLLCRLPVMTPIEMTERIFKNVRLHRNNRTYRFLLNICQLAASCLIPTEDGSKLLFRNFLRDRRAMAVLFENFVRNFYKIERPDLVVSRTDIRWKLKGTTPGSHALLPKMETDVTIQMPDRTIIIDTKYYVEALSRRAAFGSEKLNSNNLYQLHAYLTNADERLKRPITGVLLYPKVGRELDERYEMGGDWVVVRTVDLGSPWDAVDGILKSITACG